MIHFREFPLERRSTSCVVAGLREERKSHPAYSKEGPRLLLLISADIPRRLVIARRTLHSLNLADDGRNIFRCKDEGWVTREYVGR